MKRKCCPRWMIGQMEALVLSNESSWTLKTELLLGKQPKLSNKDSIHYLFLFLFFSYFICCYFFYYWDENSSSVLTLFVSAFRIK